MSADARCVVMFDVDNTLLDNDRFAADLDAELVLRFGAGERARYWQLYEQSRAQHGYADYLGALQLFRCGLANHPDIVQMSAFFLDYPFADRLYPGALDVLKAANAHNRAAILSDGDIVYQPLKVRASGLWKAVEGRVLIEVHKERAIESVRRRLRATRYIMVDDKLALLAKMKLHMGAELTTVYVEQGHYAARLAQGLEPMPNPPADVKIRHIADLLSSGLLQETL